MLALPYIPSILEPCPDCGAEYTFDAVNYSPPKTLSEGMRWLSDTLYCSRCGFTYISTTGTFKHKKVLV